jgi:SAM-dependent methyltransferase
VSLGRAPGDHVSTVSAGYAAFRPRYPRALFEFLASVVRRHHRAWDCGAGSGQATLDLAEWFDEVIGTDVSAEQIARAPRPSKVTWIVTAAESTPLLPASLDLVAIAQALHWFDHARFYDEVRRVAASNAAICAWTYGSAHLDGAAGDALRRLYGTLVDYWPPERRLVDEGYRSIPFPFERIATPSFSLADHWTLAQLVGYTRTWSSTSRFLAINGYDPVDAFERELEDLWGDPIKPRKITWPLTVLAGRVS